MNKHAPLPQGFIDAVIINDDLRCTGRHSNAFDCPIHRPKNSSDLLSDLLGVLYVTAGNIKSMRAAHGYCTTYDVWLESVETAIAKAEGKE